MKFTKILKNGMIDENPVLVQVIGMCPTLGVTTSAINGLGMGLSTTAVLICSNIVISLMRKFIPDKIRIPAFIVVIATFVTMVGMLLKAYIPALDAALGLFIPLIVVNCLILARAESFASKNTPIKSAVDGLGMGLGFTLALTALGICCPTLQPLLPPHIYVALLPGYPPCLLCLPITYSSVKRQLKDCLLCEGFPDPHPRLSSQRNPPPLVCAALTVLQ